MILLFGAGTAALIARARHRRNKQAKKKPR